MSESTAAAAATHDGRKLVQRLDLWAGIVGPVFFVVVFTIDGYLTPGYDAMKDVVSFLELGPHGSIQSVNFVLTGLMLAFFALGVWSGMRQLGPTAWRAVTSAFIGLSGVGLVMAGPFLPDPPGTASMSVTGILHAIAFTVVFLSLGLASLVAGGRFVIAAGWRIHGLYSLLAGLFPIWAALGSLYSTFAASNASSAAVSATSSQFAVGGLINRILIVVAFAWYVILACRLLRREAR